MSDIQLEDAEETPQSRHRKKIAKEFHEEKASKGIAETWYTLENGKLIHCQSTKNGNVHRVYVGNIKGCKDEIVRLQAAGKIKPVYWKP
jgi:hypothetical protein